MQMIIGNIKRQKKIIVDDNREPVLLASIGASNDDDCIEEEFKKAKMAMQYGADIVIDHTLTPNHYELQKRIIENLDIPLSAIAVYDLASYMKYSNKESYSKDDVINQFKEKAALGVDLMTIHASILKEDIDFFKKTGRIIPCTSRGGTMVMKNIIKTGEENYYWTYFDEILDIAKEYNVTISLGVAFRPANIYDSITENEMYWKEVERQAILVEKANKKGVNIMVEGIGHCPIDAIPSVIKRAKEICNNAAYRVLTVATDCALGFDHVSSAIAVSNAVMAGAEFVTAVSRSEHLSLPSYDDLKEALTTAKIAIHCGYIARTHNYKKDIEMASAREKLGCRGEISASIIPNVTVDAIKKCKNESNKKCTMCGDFCALYSSDIIKESDI